MYRRFLIVLSFILSAQAFSQMMVTKGNVGTEPFLMAETGAMIIQENDLLKIEMVLPERARPEEYRHLDLKKGDEILMMNAKRIKSIDAMKELYEGVGVGAEVKMGIRRGEEMFIVRFNKMDPEKAPQRRMMIRRSDGSGTISSTSKHGAQVLQIGPEDGNVKILMGSGLIVNEKDGVIRVHTVLPHADEIFGEGDVKAGDILKAYNDTPIKDLDAFAKEFESVAAGTKVTFTIQRENKEGLLIFEKADMSGRMMMRQE